VDLVAKPDLAADLKYTSRIAVWYWQNRVNPEHRSDIYAASRGVNGGLTGIDERMARFEQWQRFLTPEVIAQIESGTFDLASHSPPSGPSH
jgi:putative chitinase